MLLTPHTLTGVYIASQISTPFISWPVAFFSHFAFDRFPHWDYRSKNWLLLGLDLALGFSLGLFFALRAPGEMQIINILGVAFFANLPDGLEVPVVFFDKKYQWAEKLIKFQSRNQWKWNLPWGLLSQVVLVVFLLYMLL